MKIIPLLITFSLTATLIQSASAKEVKEADTSVATGIKTFLVGDWCLNQEEYEGDVSHSGVIWSFNKKGQYKLGQNSLAPYSVKDDEINLTNMGTIKVLEINQHKMVGKNYSTYYFSKGNCSEKTLQALK